MIHFELLQVLAVEKVPHTIGGFPANTGTEQLVPGMPHSSNWSAHTEGGSFSRLRGVCPRTIRLWGKNLKMLDKALVSKTINQEHEGTHPKPWKTRPMKKMMKR